MTLKATARLVLEMLEQGGYQTVDGQSVDISDSQRAAVEKTRLFSPEQFAEMRAATAADDGAPTIRVIAATTQVAARDIATSGPIALLNFASARNPGGGFLNGAKAQEEDLCRCSGLYPCLLECPEYYDFNRRQASLLYSDFAIWSPEVPFFRTSGRDNYLSAPFLASVITAPAPNSAPYLVGSPDGQSELQEAFLRRWQNVLCLARDCGAKRLLLGAWGCGAFGGDPQMAATTASLAIQRYGASLDEVIFAIPSKGKQSQRNLDTFRSVFADG